MKFVYVLILRPNTKQQTMFIWCIMDTPNLLLKSSQMVVYDNPYAIF